MSADIEDQVTGLHELRVKTIHTAMALTVSMVDHDGAQKSEPGAEKCHHLPWISLPPATALLD
jgi:hypothetical protein